MAKQEGTALLLSYPEVTIVENQVPGDEKKFQNIFQKANVTRDQICPVRDIMARVGDKWSMLAILALGGFGKLRFNELKGKIGDVSQRMLTVTLKNLENDGLITRKVYAQVPPKVEYDLTALGKSLLVQYSIFAEWASTHSDTILKSRKRNHRG
jgi:DNA-binding HxlR family transcriptional regulator